MSIYARFNGQNFNNTLINDVISFEQLGPVLCVHTFASNWQMPQ